MNLPAADLALKFLDLAKTEKCGNDHTPILAALMAASNMAIDAKIPLHVLVGTLGSAYELQDPNRTGRLN